MPPLGDLLVGSLGAVAAGDAVELERARPPERREWKDAAGNAAMAIAFFASAIYGWRQLERCDNARDAHDRWLDQHGYRKRRVAMLGGGHAR